jgi:dihydroorotate dehydrogenase electron transfer subunit
MNAQAFPISESMARVVSNDAVNAEYFHLILEATAGMQAATPGQFFHLRCPGVSGESPLLRRPMSVYRVDRVHGHVEFLYKVTGAGTRGLATLQSGDSLDVFGPLGRGFQMAPETRHVLLLARGVGMATMAPLAESAQAMGARVTAILSARSPEFLMSNDYLKSVGAVTWAVYDSHGSSDMPHVEAMITALHAEQPIDMLATCGSNRLLQLVKQLGVRFGISGQVALEQHMGCAIGMCFCCVRPFRTAEKVTYRRVCCEGPVFDVRETLSW